MLARLTPASCTIVWSSALPPRTTSFSTTIPPVRKLPPPPLILAVCALTSSPKGYAIDGTAIPDVSFDIGESYAGSLPISSNASDPNQLYWWFFPSTNPDAKKEIVIWLNGGVSSTSSLSIPPQYESMPWI